MAVDGGGETSLTKTLGDAGAKVPTISLAPAEGDTNSAFGYPAERPCSGEMLTYCQGPITFAFDGNPAMACNMTGRSSGGPWFDKSFANGFVIDSLNSYRYRSLKGYMFGPIFDSSNEGAAYNGAAVGTCPTNPFGFVCATVPVP